MTTLSPVRAVAAMSDAVSRIAMGESGSVMTISTAGRATGRVSVRARAGCAADRNPQPERQSVSAQSAPAHPATGRTRVFTLGHLPLKVLPGRGLYQEQLPGRARPECHSPHLPEVRVHKPVPPHRVPVR